MSNLLEKIKEKIEHIVPLDTEGLTNKKINEYLRLLKDKTTVNEEYNVVSMMKKDAFEKGEMVMSTWFQELVAETNAKGVEVYTKTMLQKIDKFFTKFSHFIFII